MKLKAKVSPNENAQEMFIWQVRNHQLEHPDEWVGRFFFYVKPPFYKMKAITNVEDKTMHFAFCDDSVPDHLKGGVETFVHISTKEIIEQAGYLNVRFKGKNHYLKFESVETEPRISLGDNRYLKPDLICHLDPGSEFIEICGSRSVAIEIRNSNAVSLERKAKYRNNNFTAFEIYIDKSSATEFERNCRKRGKGIPESAMEKTYAIHSNFILKLKHHLNVIHFPTEADKRKEGRHTLKAKSRLRR